MIFDSDRHSRFDRPNPPPIKPGEQGLELGMGQRHQSTTPPASRAARTFYRFHKDVALAFLNPNNDLSAYPRCVGKLLLAKAKQSAPSPYRGHYFRRRIHGHTKGGTPGRCQQLPKDSRSILLINRRRISSRRLSRVAVVKTCYGFDALRITCQSK